MTKTGGRGEISARLTEHPMRTLVKFGIVSLYLGYESGEEIDPGVRYRGSERRDRTCFYIRSFVRDSIVIDFTSNGRRNVGSRIFYYNVLNEIYLKYTNSS